MKKKLSCLILSVLLALTSVLLCSCPAADSVSAGEEEEKKEESTIRTPMTLTLWMPTDESTTDAAVAEVKAAMNKITQKEYNTSIDFCLIDSDDYEEAVNKRILEIQELEARTKAEERARKEAEREAKKQGLTIATSEEETTEVATEEDSEGVVNYPSVTSNQFDIFLIRGYEDFAYYVDEGFLSSVDDELNGSCKLMKSYIYPSFLQVAKVYGATYAIPNSHPVGEYTYLLVNKKLCDEFYYDPDDLDTILKCEEFINDVAQNSDVTPLLSTVEATGLTYWANDGEYSILATVVPDEQEYTSRLNIRNIFGLNGYVDTTLMMKKLEEIGAVSEDPENCKEFGVGVIKGTASDVEEYEEDYYVKVIRRPRATTEDSFEAMFAISTYTKDVKRSMEILNLINTNSEFRTLLQYGVEGVHWAVDEEKTKELGETVIKYLSNDYTMKLVETGNVFITYPGEGIPMSYWEEGIQQNLDSEIDPLNRFVNYIDEDNAEYFEELKTYSADVKARVDAMSAEEFEANIEALKDEVSASDAYQFLTDDEAEDYLSLVMKYLEFYGTYVRVDR